MICFALLVAQRFVSFSFGVSVVNSHVWLSSPGLCCDIYLYKPHAYKPRLVISKRHPTLVEQKNGNRTTVVRALCSL